MKLPHPRVILLGMIFLFFGCNLPRTQDTGPSPATQIFFNTPSASGSPPNSPNESTTLTPPPTIPIWPSPYFGTPGPTQITPIPPPAVPIPRMSGTTFLLLGSDSRGTVSFRTDTIIVVNWQSQDNVVTMVSIPRDLYVYIPGWRMQRINAAFIHGELEPALYPNGESLLKDTLLYNLGIAIDHTIIVDFSGFQRIIDAMGGIDVPVTCKSTEWRLIRPDADPEEEDNWQLYTVEPGVVHMNGEFALWYARSRLKSTDYQRNRRQQEILRAMHTQAISLNLISRLPELYSELSDAFSSDLTLNDILAVAPMAFNLTSAHIRSYYIDGDYVTVWRTPIDRAYTMIPKDEKIHNMLLQAFSPPNDIEQDNLETRIEIINRSIHPDWGVLAAERLAYAGFETSVTNSNQSNSTPTTLIDLNDQRDLNQVNYLAGLLDIMQADVLYESSTNSDYSYRLIVGDDFSPCFLPNDLAR